MLLWLPLDSERVATLRILFFIYKLCLNLCTFIFRNSLLQVNFLQFYHYTQSMSIIQICTIMPLLELGHDSFYIYTNLHNRPPISIWGRFIYPSKTICTILSNNPPIRIRGLSAYQVGRGGVLAIPGAPHSLAGF